MVQLEPIKGLDDTTTQSETTWDASVAYAPNDDRLYYLRGATGFRQGGINDSNSAQQLGVEIPPTYDPDTVLSIELGAKTSWVEDRVTANAAYFKMFWDDIQVSGQDPTGSVNFIDNAAKAEIDGLEFELMATPTDAWLLTFAATWLDAQLTEDQVVDDPNNVRVPGRQRRRRDSEGAGMGALRQRGIPFPCLQRSRGGSARERIVHGRIVRDISTIRSRGTPRSATISCSTSVRA